MKTKLLLILITFLYSTSFLLAQSKNETTAVKWINENKQKLEIQDIHKFKMLFNRKSLSGETLRYYQMVNDVQVFDAEITIHLNNKGVITYHASTYDKTVQTINTTPSITENEALEKVITNLNITGNITQKESKLYVYNKLDKTKLVYRIVTLSEFKNGYWESIIDANTGEVLSTKDIAIYHNENSKTKKEEPKKKEKKNEDAFLVTSVNGTAMVFDTDPLTATTSLYGGQYVDNNDATNTSLNNARTAVTLLDIDLTGGVYTLKGPYVEIASLQAPNTGLFQQGTSNFSFTRDQQGFEAANCYYHLDKSIRYINVNLGITLVSLFNSGVLRYDPHAFNGADNSSYGGGSLNFGEGGVDDAEDADVILHELGHGLHDWITNGSLSQVNGLSEGCGDYWANSYKRSLGQWNSTQNSYYYVFGWDGHNPFWNGRTTNYPNLYPGGLGGGIHAEGQIWASALMEIWEIIGKEKTDKAFLEGLGMTNNSTNHPNAAIAVRQAALDMGTAHGFTCADITTITDRFNARGYNLPAINCTLVVSDLELQNIAIYPNPTTNEISLSNIYENYEIEIYNILGQKTLSKNITPNNNTIDVLNLEKGVYILKFKEQDVVLKFIKK